MLCWKIHEEIVRILVLTIVRPFDHVGQVGIFYE